MSRRSDENGLVQARRMGETAILVRAAGKAASATVGVIGDRRADYPAVSAFQLHRRFRVWTSCAGSGFVPRELSSDSEFLRRVCLDLAGTLPPPERVREFLASQRSEETREADRYADRFARSSSTTGPSASTISSAWPSSRTASSRSGARCMPNGCGRTSRPTSRTTRWRASA